MERPSGRTLQPLPKDNDRFGSLLPREGELVRRVASTDGCTDWWLVRLDEPLEYEVGKIAESARDETRVRTGDTLSTRYLLIRSRWKGHSIGEEEPTSVFLLLVDDLEAAQADEVDIHQFLHVAWGMCHSLSFGSG